MNKIAKERIKKLIDMATESEERGKRYIEIARKIGTKTRTKIPKEDKLKFCRKCNEPYHAGSFKVRINSKKDVVVYTCLKCGEKHRYPFTKEKKS